MRKKIYSMLALLLTVTQGAWAQTLPTDGTGAYLISSVDDWNTFCEDVTGGITYSGKTVKLTQNVGPVTTMAGYNTSFSGTFDGQGYTLTVSINVQNDNMGTNAAPFVLIGGATIKNLHVAGNISVNRARPASIASFVNDDSEITNCKSSVSITASRDNWVDAGGFVARVDAGKALTMTGCAFTGSITYTNAAGYEGGGMVGWTQANASANLTNCLFAPTSVSFANSKSKADNNFRMLVGGVGSSTLTRCYYNDVAANNTKIITDGEGKQARSISAGTDVTISGLGDATATYNVSGITAYATGIKYNDVYYAGNGESVSLALSHADKAGYAFNQYAVAGGGTLTAQTETSATLSMTDANQTINATWTPTYTVTVKEGTEDATSWQGKAGEGEYQALPLEGVAAGTAVSVKYNGTKKVKSVKAVKKAAAPSVPDGAINGKFSVSDTKQVYFSKGNLQYDGTNWKFAASQWEVLGANGTGATGTATNYPMDLFTWGNTSNSTEWGGTSYYTENANLSGTTDWGSRMGSGWYTLSKDEWLYLFGMESNNTDKSGHARYRKYFRAKVNGLPGIVVLPDDLSGISDIPAESSRGTASDFNGKTYTTDAWSAMESAGCVFLPAAGFRNGTSVSYVGSSGFYWPSTAYDAGKAYTVGFDSDNVYPANNFNRTLGFSVRLVREVAE